MLKGYLPKRLLWVSAAAVCIAIATPTIVRRWMIDHFSTTLNAPVSIGEVRIYPRSGTLLASDVTLGNEHGPAYFKIAQSWLTWKNDSWSDGALRFRRAILDDVRIEADLVSHDYFGVFAQLKAQQSSELIPSIYKNDVNEISAIDAEQHAEATYSALLNYRTIWNQAKKKLSESTVSLNEVLAQVEARQQMQPNSLRNREELESTMKQAVETRQTYLHAKHQMLTFADRISQMEAELEQKQQEDVQRVQAELRIDDMIFQDLSEQMLKEHCLAQTSVWLDYIATGRTLLGGMQLPEFNQQYGTDFHFAKTAPEAQTVIDEMTMKGVLSLHHRSHDIFLRGFNLRSFPETQTITQVNADHKSIATLKPTVLRGEIKSRGQALLFDFRRLWETHLKTDKAVGSFPQMSVISSDVITLESPAVGPQLGEMRITPAVSLAWQGKSPWVWSQWRFDEKNKWRAKWVIRQEDLVFSAQDLSKDQRAQELVESITTHVATLNRIDIEMDITCVEDQYAISITSNLDAWLPEIVKLVYRNEEQSQMEKIRTAIHQHKVKEVSELIDDVESERAKLNRDTEPLLARLEKLSTGLASKLGVSPRLMLSQEGESDLKR